MFSRCRSLLLALLGTTLVAATGTALTPQVGMAAETVSLRYGPFQTSVPAEDLRKYAETGEASERLSALLKYVKEPERASFRKGLQFKAPMDVVAVDKLLSSPLGNQLLTRISKIILFRPESAGILALQGGLVTAAASKDGLGVMSFIDNYPGGVLEVDVQQALKDGGNLGSLFQGFMGAPRK